MRNPRKEENLELEAPAADELEVRDPRAEDPEVGAFLV